MTDIIERIAEALCKASGHDDMDGCRVLARVALAEMPSDNDAIRYRSALSHIADHAESAEPNENFRLHVLVRRGMR